MPQTVRLSGSQDMRRREVAPRYALQLYQQDFGGGGP